MRAIKNFVDVEEARRAILSRISYSPRVKHLRPVEAVGRVIGDNISAPIDRPPKHVSHMDGYALSSADTRDASPHRPVKLKVEGFIGPAQAGGQLRRGAAARIHTGGYLPEGADSVIPQEEVALDGEYVLVPRPLQPFENVDRRGSDIQRGQLLVERGEVLSAPRAALLESIGVLDVPVLERVRASVISFGDELTDDLEEAREGRVLNTHARMILSMLDSLGLEAVYRGLSPDEPEEARRRVLEALSVSDGLLTIGGSSVGDVDVVASSISGMSELFTQGLKLQPGRVGGFAVVKGKPVIMLPGLIHSTVNVFNYIAAPVFAAMQGMKIERLVITRTAELKEDVRMPEKWIDFVRVAWARLEPSGDRLLAEPLLGESSQMAPIAFADGYFEIPPGRRVLEAGCSIRVLTPLWMRPARAR